MNRQELLKYMKQNAGVALVGKAESMESAISLEKQGMAERIGSLEGKIYFKLTPTGINFVEYLDNKLGGSKGTKFKKGLKVAAGLFQDYATAFKREHPTGLFSEIRSMSDNMRSDQPGGLGSMEFPGLGYTKPRALEDKKAKAEKSPKVTKVKLGDEEFVEIDGKVYKKQK